MTREAPTREALELQGILSHIDSLARQLATDATSSNPYAEQAFREAVTGERAQLLEQFHQLLRDIDVDVANGAYALETAADEEYDHEPDYDAIGVQEQYEQAGREFR